MPTLELGQYLAACGSWSVMLNHDAFDPTKMCSVGRIVGLSSTSSAFKPFAGIERDKLETVEGAETLLVWGDDGANHTRCGICGSLLYSVVRDGAYVHVALGSLIGRQRSFASSALSGT